MEYTMQQAAETALACQNACNLSGVLLSFSDIVQGTIWPEARRLGEGTDFVNTHPIVTLFLDKLCALNGGYVVTPHYAETVRKCEALARGEAVTL